MACILALPNGERKGIVSITTSEINQIMNNDAISPEARSLKKSFYLGLHHNWHPVDFRLPIEFDFHFLESRDLIFAQNDALLLEMDACNFTPQSFSKPRNNPTWDLLIVGRSTSFKRPFKTLEVVRDLYDQGHLLKILWICPMNLDNSDDRAVAEAYENLFTTAEMENFTLLNPASNNPFTFSREELALFYLSSKIYVHFADTETRCRTAAYAFCAGMPVVGNSVIANILPMRLATEPTFYQVRNDDYVKPILSALSKPRTIMQLDCKEVLSEERSILRFVNSINNGLKPTSIFEKHDIFSADLDIRLGAAHLGIKSSNSSSLTLKEFIVGLQISEVLSVLNKNVIKSMQPERELENLLLFAQDRIVNVIDLSREALLVERKREIFISKKGNARFILYQILVSVEKIPIVRNLARVIFQFLKNRVK